MNFGEKLRELRTQLGMTQTALAAAAKVSLGAIRNYEQGIREPYWDIAFRLAAALGSPVTVFAECLGPPPKKRKGAK